MDVDRSVLRLPPIIKTASSNRTQGFSESERQSGFALPFFLL
jgi:hypothetical protein